MTQRSGGQPLDAATRDSVGARLGADLGGVRLHTDQDTAAVTQALGVRGLTVGQQIFGGPDLTAAPGGASQVLLHELAHVAQSGGAEPAIASNGSVAVDPENSAAEREAHGAAARLAAGQSAQVSPAPAAARFFRDGPGADTEGGNAGADPTAGSNAGGDPGGGAGGGDEAVLIAALREGGPERARQMLREVEPGRRGTVESAIRGAFEAEQAEQIIQEVPASGGGGTPEVAEPTEDGAPTGDGGPDGQDGGPGAQADPAGGPAGAEGNQAGGPAPAGNGPTAPGPAGGGSEAGGAAAGGLEAMPESDLALIYEELVEHQIWQRAGDRVGEAGSVDRAAFIAEVAGQGAISGAASGAAMGALMGFAGKLTARFIPVPGVGAVLGGAMAAYTLMSPDTWMQAGDAIGKFGEGGSTYEVLANSIAAISTIIDLAVNIMNVIAGVIGVISAVMWIISIVTVGVASPLAGTLSAIAMGIGAVSGVLDLINTLILQPVVLLFRALHTFTSEADPREVEAQGAGIADASSKAAGALGGWVGGKAGEFGGGRAAGAISSRTSRGGGTPDAPTSSRGGGTPDAPTSSRGGGDGPAAGAAPDAPAPARASGDGAPAGAAPDAPAPDAPAPAPARAPADGAPAQAGAPARASGAPDGAPGRAPAGDSPEVQRARAQADVDADAGQSQQSHRERIAAEAERHQRLQEDIQQSRQRELADAQQRGQDTRRREIGDAFESRRAEIEADMNARIDEAASQRRRADTEVADAAHQMHLEEIRAAGSEQQHAIRESGRVAEIERSASRAEHSRRQQEIDGAQTAFERAEAQRQASEAAALQDVDDPAVRDALERQWARERADRQVQQAERTLADTEANNRAMRERDAAIEADRQRAIDDAARAHDQRMRDAEQRKQQMVDDARAEADRMEAEARQQADRDLASARQERETRLEAEPEAAGRDAASARGSELDTALADSRSRLAETRRDNALGAIREGMDHNRAAYDMQENWRPWGELEPRTRLGKVAAFALNEVVWPFMDDVIAPWANHRRGNLGASGQPTRATDGRMPFSRGGNAVKSNENAAKALIQAGLQSTVQNEAKEAVGMEAVSQDAHGARFTADNQAPAGRGDAATYELVQTERFNPNYQDPPGTPQELEQIMDRIEHLMAERERARQAEGAMAREQATAEQNQGPIDGLVTASEDSVALGTSHQQAVARRQASNQAQQQRQQEASQLISDYANRKAGVAAITVPLTAFQGFTHIASALPGSAGAAMQSMNRDANRLSEAFSSMDERMAEQGAAQPERTQALTQDAASLDQTASQGQTSSEELSTARDGAQGLAQANQQSREDAAAARAEAQTEGANLEGAAQTEQQRYQTLSAQLSAWAVSHRDARQTAIAAQAASASQPRAFGSEHQPPVGDFVPPRSDVAFA